MLKADTKLVFYGNSKSSILIPYDVRSDSSFPFEDDQELEIEINDKKLIVTAKKA